jgi:AhpD family alkylhydroperoxidase
MFISHLKDSTPQVDGQSDLRHLFAYDPARTQHLLQFTQAAMRWPGALTPGERELVAAMTSRENQCLFWIGSHAAVAAQLLGRDTVDRVLDRRSLTPREQALWQLVDASREREELDRRAMVIEAARSLTPDEVYLASMVIALFNFYNTFVDLNGVDELSAEMYDASGLRLATAG